MTPGDLTMAVMRWSLAFLALFIALLAGLDKLLDWQIRRERKRSRESQMRKYSMTPFSGTKARK